MEKPITMARVRMYLEYAGDDDEEEWVAAPKGRADRTIGPLPIADMLRIYGHMWCLGESWADSLGAKEKD